MNKGGAKVYIYKTKLSNETFLDNAKNTLVSKYIDEINGACNKFKNTAISSLNFSKFRLYDETGDRAVYQKDYFEHRRRLTMFMLRTWLFKEADDIKELEDILWAVCDEYSWALPAHLAGIFTNDNILPNRVDLFAAETAHTIAETLSLCGELIHPAVAKRCINEISKRIFEPFESEDSEKYGLHWEKSQNNWAAVCGGAVGMTGLYLIADSARLRKIINRSKSACNNFLASCADDGVCMEGVSYWMYAMQYYVAFDCLLKERLDETINSDEEKIKRIALFPSVVCMSNNITVKFSDCADTHLFFGIFCKLHEQYGTQIPDKSYYTHLIDRCARTAGAVRTIAWFNPKLLNSAPLKEDVFLGSGQIATLHCDTMTAVIKGGHNNEPHNHNDIGSYMFIKGERVITDELGAAKYTKAYFEPEKRYEFLNASSRGHSLPTVNGYTQIQGAKAKADRFEKKGNKILVSFKDAYDKNSALTSLLRNMSLNKGGLMISDSFGFSSKANKICERIITKYDAETENESSVIISENCNHIASIKFLQKGRINILKEDYTVPNSSGKSDEYSSENELQYVNIIEFEYNADSYNAEITYIIK